MRIFAAACALAVLFACGPNPKPPVKVMAVVPSVSGPYETRQVELTTITNLTTLQGSVAKLIGGARVVFDPTDPMQTDVLTMDDATRYSVLVKEKGGDVRGNFVDKSGVLWPADFHTWNMVTAYYNFERAAAYYTFIADGKDLPELVQMPVMYWPQVYLSSPDPLQDNALYLSFVKAFVLVPYSTTTDAYPNNTPNQKVPMAMNIGVIGHETAHRVFNHRVLLDAGFHEALISWNLQPFNLLKSLDEGLADFHGYGVTCGEVSGCKPAFLEASVNDAATVAARNLSLPGNCMDANVRSAFRTFTSDQWVRAPEMYKVGTLFATALYLAGSKTGKMSVVQKGLLAAYDDPSPANPGLNQLLNGNLNTPDAFTPEAVADVIVGHMPTGSEVQKELCNQFSTRLQLVCGAFPCIDSSNQNLMPHCPVTSARSSECPALPQP